jgi:hypothetical protein
MAHKGRRTTKQRDKQYSLAVDIPIPRDGLWLLIDRERT